MTTRYIITEHELEAIIQASGDVVRAAYGSGNMERSQDRLDKYEEIVLQHEVPEWVTHFGMEEDDKIWRWEEI